MIEIKLAIDRIFSQLILVLEGLSNDEYSKASNSLNSATIGQHVRHSLEFFSCLMQGVEIGKVNYDNRERNIFLENNTLEALTLISKLKEEIESSTENTSLQLAQCYYPEKNSIEVESNFYRELIYNIEHAVHHMALIRIGLREVKPDMKLPEEFGIASSTIKYRKVQQIGA